MTDRYGKDGYQYHKCPYFWNAIQKYGWENFEHIVLIENLSKEVADIMESELIKNIIQQMLSTDITLLWAVTVVNYQE